jgi:hypothetical protein
VDCPTRVFKGWLPVRHTDYGVERLAQYESETYKGRLMTEEEKAVALATIQKLIGKTIESVEFDDPFRSGLNLIFTDNTCLSVYGSDYVDAEPFDVIYDGEYVLSEWCLEGGDEEEVFAKRGFSEFSEFMRYVTDNEVKELP